MDPQKTGQDPHEHPHHVKPTRGSHHAAAHPPHHVQPIDPGYRLVVHITLWVIAGALLVGLCVWWVVT